MIKLLIGGSPCTHWSIAQSHNRETEPKGLGWELFKNYLLAKDRFKPDFFLYENNKSAATPIKEQISRELGVELMYINSALVSAQNRQRFYAFNWKVEQPNDRGLFLRDIIEPRVDEKYYMKYPLVLKDSINKNLIQIGDIPKTSLNDNERQRRVYSVDGKSPTVLARSDSAKILCVGTLEMKASQQIRRVYSINGKSPTVDCATGGHRQVKILDNATVRKLTPLECERLQTLPDNYTQGVSNTQRYKQIGNGWTAEVIIHILNGVLNNIDRHEKIIVLSMYDGIGTGRYCLDKMGFTNVEYYAFEIDKYAMQVANDNYPDIIQCGDAFQMRDNTFNICNLLSDVF